ncbi:MAG: response regulator [Proteobacteria bacterium]|nr:response regulator [Pseudomonadota bacterium]
MTDVTNNGHRRVLVVDDDKDAVRILSDFLEVKEFQPVPAYDGYEALARFHDEGPFDVIVLDVMMPGLDGLEVCRQMKESKHGQLTPVLLLSARSDTRSRIAGLYGGADDYMSKPVDLREFAARVDVLLRVRDQYAQLAERRADQLESATRDGLSGAVKREYFMQRLQEEISRADRYKLELTVAVLDLVGLPEPVQSGDWRIDEVAGEVTFAGPAHRLVQAVGDEVSGRIRSHDLFARLRRGRFALLMPHTSKKVVQPVLARLQEGVEAIQADPDGDNPARAGLSLKVGWAELGPRMDALTLLACAEPT